MTNAILPGELQRNRLLSVRDFWRIRHDTDRLMLEESLIYDGRFYGAEYWMEPFERTEGILAPYLTGYIDPVEIVRQIRDPSE